MLTEKTNQTTDQEQFIRSNAPTAMQATYIGETGRNLTTRLTELKRVSKKGDLNNNITEHDLKTSHAIDWDCVTCSTVPTSINELHSKAGLRT